MQDSIFRIKPSNNTQTGRLIAALADGRELSTVAVRADLAIGNPSDVARKQNALWRAAGDPRRILCDVRQIENRFGQQTRLGYWRLGTVMYYGEPAANDERGE